MTDILRFETGRRYGVSLMNEDDGRCEVTIVARTSQTVTTDAGKTHRIRIWGRSDHARGHIPARAVFDGASGHGCGFGRGEEMGMKDDEFTTEAHARFVLEVEKNKQEVRARGVSLAIQVTGALGGAKTKFELLKMAEEIADFVFEGRLRLL